MLCIWTCSLLFLLVLLSCFGCCYYFGFNCCVWTIFVGLMVVGFCVVFVYVGLLVIIVWCLLLCTLVICY